LRLLCKNNSICFIYIFSPRPCLYFFYIQIPSPIYSICWLLLNSSSRHLLGIRTFSYESYSWNNYEIMLCVPKRQANKHGERDLISITIIIIIIIIDELFKFKIQINNNRASSNHDTIKAPRIPKIK
jgi:hypothetical protein